MILIQTTAAGGLALFGALLVDRLSPHRAAPQNSWPKRLAMLGEGVRGWRLAVGIVHQWLLAPCIQNWPPGSPAWPIFITVPQRRDMEVSV